MSKETLNNFDKIRIAFVRALLGEVIPSLRFLTFDLNELQNELSLSFYHDGEINENIKKHYESVVKKAKEDIFLKNIVFKKFEINIKSLSYPKVSETKQQYAIYARDEPFINPVNRYDEN